MKLNCLRTYAVAEEPSYRWLGMEEKGTRKSIVYLGIAMPSIDPGRAFRYEDLPYHKRKQRETSEDTAVMVR